MSIRFVLLIVRVNKKINKITKDDFLKMLHIFTFVRLLQLRKLDLI